VDIVLYLSLALVALWVITKVFRAVGSAAMGRVEKSMLDSDAARAIRDAVAAVGHYDGTSEAKQRAQAAFVDLAENGPLDLGGQRPVADLARDCVDGLTRDSGPILLETAWTVVGAHRFYQRDEPGPTTREEREWARQATTLFAALFGDWTKEMVKTYRVGTPAELRESQRRMAMVIDLLLDRCERFGLLHQG